MSNTETNLDAVIWRGHRKFHLNGSHECIFSKWGLFWWYLCPDLLFVLQKYLFGVVFLLCLGFFMEGFCSMIAPSPWKDTNCQVQVCLWKSWLMDKGTSSSLHPGSEIKLKPWDMNCLFVQSGWGWDVRRNICFVSPDFYDSFPCLVFECSWRISGN